MTHWLNDSFTFYGSNWMIVIEVIVLKSIDLNTEIRIHWTCFVSSVSYFSAQFCFLHFFFPAHFTFFGVDVFNYQHFNYYRNSFSPFVQIMSPVSLWIVVNSIRYETLAIQITDNEEKKFRCQDFSSIVTYIFTPSIKISAV